MYLVFFFSEVNCICLGHDKLYAAYSDKTICVWPLDKVNSTFDPLPLNPVSIVWFDSAPHIASFSKRNSILVVLFLYTYASKMYFYR